MVGTRSGAGRRVQVEVHIRRGERVQDRGSRSASSESEEEEIPFTSPPKSTIDPGIRSLDHRRHRSQQPQTGRVVKPRLPRRRKTDSLSSPRGAHIYLTPTSSTKGPILAITTQDKSRAASPEDAVPPGLVNSVNATLKKKGRGGPRRPPVSAEGEEHGHEENAQAQFDHSQVVDSQGVQDSHTSSTPGRGELLSISPGSHKRGGRSDVILGKNGQLEHDTGETISLRRESQSGLLDVPSPSKEEPLQRGQFDGRISRHNSPAAQSFQVNQVGAAEHHQPASPRNHNDIRVPTQPEGSVDEREEVREDAIPSDAWELVGVSDDENLSDADLSSQESFAQDVANFRARYPEGYGGDEVFEGPLEDDDVAIHIDPTDLNMALRLMGHGAWAGLGRRWYQKPFNIDSSGTGPVRMLLRLLAKLERLYVAAPRAPRIAEQNRFLDEYSDLLSYYFSKIRLVIRHIRGKRPGKKLPDQSRSNSEDKLREKISEEIASLAIPMLFHVLASAWNLGGYDWGQSSFTTSTVELLRRTLGWVGLLYHPFLRSARQRGPDHAQEESKHRSGLQHTQERKREELEGPLKSLRQTIGAGPDALREEELRRYQEGLARELQLGRQKETEDHVRQEEELMMMATREQQWRSLMSIRGVYTPLSEPRVSTFTRGSSTSQEPSRTSPSSRRVVPWSTEEKIFLFKKIQESYPDLLDLDDVRWELNRTLEETEAMAEELLGLMVEAVRPDVTAADRDAHVHEIMQNYRRTWGH